MLKAQLVNYKNLSLATLSLVATIAGSAFVQSPLSAYESSETEFKANVLEIQRSPVEDTTTLGVVKN